MKPDKYIKNIISRYKTPAFIDENGLGAIFGELSCCAIQIENDFYDDRVNDSKKINLDKLYEIAKDLINSNKVTYVFETMNPQTLNSIKNIHRANRINMINAVKKLPKPPDAIFIDGKYTLPETGIITYAIVKGDSKVFGIAVASIIGKYLRDTLIINNYGESFNKYDIINNKGYGTPKHIEAIKKYGLTKYHRLWLYRLQQFISK